MAILSITPGITGLAAVVPNLVLINTNDTQAAVTTAGYLNSAHAEGFVFNNDIMALVTTSNEKLNWYNVVVTGTPGFYVYSLSLV